MPCRGREARREMVGEEGDGGRGGRWRGREGDRQRWGDGDGREMTDQEEGRTGGRIKGSLHT